MSVACQQEIILENPVQNTGEEFVASLECFDGPTKTSMTEENSIVWTKGDQIAIFQGATVADTYQVKEQCDGTSSGIFTLISDNSEVNGEFSSGMEIPANIAVYPYSDGLGCSSKTVSEGGVESTFYTISGFQFPSSQQYQANSFAQESFAMVAVTNSVSDHSLKFKNVNGALKLQLCGECAVKRIILKGNNNEKLAGSSSITAYPGAKVPSITMSAEATGTITLDCGDGVQLDPAVPTLFIISVPPTVFSNGFTVKVVDTEGKVMPIKASVSNEIKRSSVLKMPVVTVPITSAGTENIVFEDDEMKELCVTAFDTDKDGELSYAEAAAVTDLYRMTLSNKTFQTFNEFQYFTSVKTIPYSYFSSCESLKEITFPNSITSIGNRAFKECSNLTAVVMNEGITSIGSEAFYYCTSLTSITIPESVTSIDYGAFSECSSLTSITIPESVTEITNYTFYKCTSLTSITIPESVSQIMGSAFEDCTSLTSITIPENVTTIEFTAFADCTSLTSIYFKATSLSTYGSNAFANCPATIYVPLGSEEAYKAGWPEYASRIVGCWKLAKYVIFEDDEMKELCLTAFDTDKDGELSYAEAAAVTDLYRMTLSNKTFQTFNEFQYFTSVKTIPYSYFSSCESLKEITFPNSITSIGNRAFKECSNLTAVVMNEGITSIGSEAFYYCTSLTSITIPESVTEINEHTFYNCSKLTSITIPESVKKIMNGAFSRCSSLTSITIPESVTEINDFAFYYCSKLTSITIPESVKKIMYGAFFGCSSMTSTYIKAISLSTYGEYAFSECPVTIYVPLGSEEAYKASWPSYASRIVGYDYSNAL